MEIDESYFGKNHGKLAHLRILAPKIFHGIIIGEVNLPPYIYWQYARYHLPKEVTIAFILLIMTIGRIPLTMRGKDRTHPIFCWSSHLDPQETSGRTPTSYHLGMIPLTIGKDRTCIQFSCPISQMGGNPNKPNLWVGCILGILGSRGDTTYLRQWLDTSYYDNRQDTTYHER